MNLPRIVWIYGPPCAGKTKLLFAIRNEHEKLGVPFVVLDGDDYRSGVSSDLGFKENDRRENIRRAAETARLLSRQHFNVGCAFVTPLEKHRQLVREILGCSVKLIQLDCTKKTAILRDEKGVYLRSNHYGDLEYEETGSPDFRIDTDKSEGSAEIDEVIQWMMETH